MRTYPRTKDDIPYQIQFRFLDAVCNFLNSCNERNFEAIYGRQEEAENAIAALFTAKTYAQGTIFNKLRKELPEIYSKISNKEWKQKFPASEHHSREHIIEVIGEIQRR